MVEKNTKDEIINVSSNTEKAIKARNRKETTKKIFAKGYMWLILLLMYLPILVLVIYSFTESDQLGVWTGFHLICITNYLRINL